MIVGGSVKKAEKDSLVQEILETITFNESDGEEQELNEIEDQNDDYDIDDLGELQAYTGSEKEIVLPDGISVIGVLAFAFNNKVTSIIISEGVESIKSEAFCRCVNLNTVELPSSLRNISDGVFYNCYSLNTIELPSGLRKIGNGAFDGCMELTSISIPDGCEEIGIEAFKYCKKLKDIYVPDSVYEIGEDAFCTFNYDTVIHTVRGSVAEKFAKENDLKFDYDNAPLSDSDFSVNIQESSDGEAQKLSDVRAQSLNGLLMIMVRLLPIEVVKKILFYQMEYQLLEITHSLTINILHQLSFLKVLRLLRIVHFGVAKI